MGIALAESDLASLYGLERKFPKALDYAERAYDVLVDAGCGLTQSHRGPADAGICAYWHAKLRPGD